MQRNTGTTAACVEKEWHGGSSVCHVTAGSNASGGPPVRSPRAPNAPRAHMSDATIEYYRDRAIGGGMLMRGAWPR